MRHIDDEHIDRISDQLLRLPLAAVMDEADVLCGIEGGCGLSQAQLRWTQGQLAGRDPRSIAQAFQDALDRLALAIAHSGRDVA